jgi:hypothetical protein
MEEADVSAFIATAFAQDDAEAARTQRRRVADQIRPKLPKLATFLDEAEPDVLAYLTFPAAHRAKLHSTNPIERLNGEIKRRTDVVGIFPNEEAIIRTRWRNATHLNILHSFKVGQICSWFDRNSGSELCLRVSQFRSWFRLNSGSELCPVRELLGDQGHPPILKLLGKKRMPAKRPSPFHSPPFLGS